MTSMAEFGLPTFKKNTTETTGELRINTAIHSQYRVLDASGRWPFSVVFGLCRRSPTDTDTRPIVLHTANSVFDVPYGLVHGLLTLHEEHAAGEPLTPVKLPDELKSSCGEQGAYVKLSSPVGRTGPKLSLFSAYEYRIAPDSELSSLFEVGKKYTMRIASRDLGVKWWAYLDGDHVVPDKQTQASEDTILSNSKSNGKVSFKVVPSLPHPPTVEVSMRRSQNEESAGDSRDTCNLEISAQNTGDRPIAVQTRGSQRYLVPWGPFQPAEEPGFDFWSHIIDGSPAPSLSLLIFDAATGDVVRKAKKLGVCGGGASAGFRPKLESLVTLTPGEPLIRTVDISSMLSGLPDGKYVVRMWARPAWWCDGSREDIADEGDGRIPKQICNTLIPPLMLQTEDQIEVQVEGGKHVQ